MTTTQRSLESIEPPDCYARARQLRAEVELIRVEMGRAAAPRAEVKVEGAAPREVYFVALALFRKADRLSYELTGDEMFSLPMTPPVTKLRPGHVLRVLDAAGLELTNVRRELEVSDVVTLPVREDSRTPSDVLGELFTINRGLNTLLAQPFSPSDVLQQIHVARDLASALLLALGGDPEKIAVPTYARRKRPMDVFGTLLTAMESLRKIASASGLSVLSIREGLEATESVVPGDVFDLASLVLAEVSFLHSHLKEAPTPEAFASHHIGRKLPSHCFQIAQHLVAILAAVNERVATKSDWTRG